MHLFSAHPEFTASHNTETNKYHATLNNIGSLEYSYSWFGPTTCMKSTIVQLYCTHYSGPQTTYRDSSH